VPTPGLPSACYLCCAPTSASVPVPVAAPARVCPPNPQPSPPYKDFEEIKTNRAAALLDFDANRRRLTDLEQQKALAEAKGKNVGDAAIALDQKIDKYVRR